MDRNWERVEAQDVQRGDLIAKTRNDEPAEVIDVGPVSERARWLTFPRGRIRPRHETKFWRLLDEAPEEEPAEEPSSAPPAAESDDAPIDPHGQHSREVQAVLHSAGMSLNSELTPEQLARAQELADGKIEIQSKDPRFAFIMRGERSSTMTSNGKRRSSDTQKALEAALQVLKKARKPLSRKEIHEGALKLGVDLGLKPSGGPKIGGIVNGAAFSGTEVDGYRFTNPERGKYSVEKVKGAKASGAKSSAKSRAKAGAGKAKGGGAKK